MAVTPKQTRELTNEEKNIVKTLEKRIDEGLMQRRYTFDAKLFPSINVREKVIQIYEKAGWKVKYESDQREGDYLQFSEAPKRSRMEGYYSPY